MAERKKKNNRRSETDKAKAKETPKKSGNAAAKPKAAAQPQKRTRAKKPAEIREPKPPAQVLKELREIAERNRANTSPAKPTPKVTASKSGEATVAPPKSGKVKEITVKYRFD